MSMIRPGLVHLRDVTITNAQSGNLLTTVDGINWFNLGTGTTGQVLSVSSTGSLAWVDTDVATTFENGITENAGVAKLGGVLTENTTVTSAAFNLVFTNGAGEGILVNPDRIEIASNNDLRLLGQVVTEISAGQMVQYSTDDGSVKASTYRMPTSVASGDILYVDANGDVTTLPKGAAGKILQMDANGSFVTWGDGNTVDIFVDGATWDATTALLTLTDNDGNTPDVNVDLSALRSVYTDDGNGTYTLNNQVDAPVTITTYSKFTSLSDTPSTLGTIGQILELVDDGNGNSSIQWVDNTAVQSFSINGDAPTSSALSVSNNSLVNFKGADILKVYTDGTNDAVVSFDTTGATATQIVSLVDVNGVLTPQFVENPTLGFTHRSVLFADVDGSITEDTSSPFLYNSTTGALQLGKYGTGSISPTTTGGNYLGMNGVPFFSDEGILTEWLPDGTSVRQPSLYTYQADNGGIINSGLYINFDKSIIDNYGVNGGGADLYGTGLRKGEFGVVAGWMNATTTIERSFAMNDAHCGISTFSKKTDDSNPNYSSGASFSLSAHTGSLEDNVNGTNMGQVAVGSTLGTIDFKTGLTGAKNYSWASIGMSAKTVELLNTTGSGGVGIQRGAIEFSAVKSTATNWYESGRIFEIREEYIGMDYYGTGAITSTAIDTKLGNAVDTTTNSNYIARFTTDGKLVEQEFSLLGLIDTPNTIGTTGQILKVDENGNVVWADDSAGTFTGARNGVNFSSGFVELGGDLTKNTAINGVGNTFAITNANNTLFQVAPSGVNMLGSVIGITGSTGVVITASNAFQLTTPDAANRVGGMLQQVATGGNAEYTPYALPITAPTVGQILKATSTGDLVWADDADTNSMTTFTVNGHTQGAQDVIIGDGATLLIKSQEALIDVRSYSADNSVSVDFNTSTATPGQALSFNGNSVVWSDVSDKITVENISANTTVTVGQDILNVASSTAAQTVTVTLPSPASVYNAATKVSEKFVVRAANLTGDINVTTPSGVIQATIMHEGNNTATLNMTSVGDSYTLVSDGTNYIIV